eukprot:TRINITY_DN870_c0_g1_i1.p1 TRINITY_DN870_c0_g1~~TRINITY_DN870_c0_g1_i1.p1  ORF type:complete len:148 (+),score=71.99 TRINITY_DN870_c0_g1_i1:112-555(+)
MSQPQTIQLSSLAPEQLQQIKQELGEEIQKLVSSILQLKELNGRFISSKETLKSLTPANNEKRLLIPITSSIYIPGQISDVETVTIDIGTGYYVKQSIPSAEKHFDRKIKMVSENIEKLSKELAVKRNTNEAISVILQQKLTQAARK